MKRWFCLFLAAALLLTLSGCANAGDAHYARLAALAAEYPMPDEIPEGTQYKRKLVDIEPVLEQLPDDDLSGTLTVMVGTVEGVNTESEDIQLFAEEFMMLHPNVVIRFITPSGYDSTRVYTPSEKKRAEEAAREKFRVEMMSRTADYMVFGCQFLLSSYYQMSENNMLLDLWPWFQDDPDIREEDYFMNALNAFTVDGKLTMVPWTFSFDDVFFNRSVLEEIGVDEKDLFAVSTDDLLTWYEQARELEPDLQFLFSAQGKDKLYPMEQRACLDFEKKQANFLSPEFLTFLRRTDAVIDDDPDIGRERGWARETHADEALRFQATGEEPGNVLVSYYTPYKETEPSYVLMTKMRRSFAILRSSWLGEQTWTQHPMEYMAGPYPLVSSDGSLGVSSEEYFVVPSCMTNHDLAWEFIKYCVGTRPDYPLREGRIYQTQQWYSTHPIFCDIPINRRNFRKLGGRMGEFMNCNMGVFGYTNFEDMDVDAWEASLDRTLGLELANYMRYGLGVSDFLEEFYVNQLTTPEQCAEKLQGRAAIWLNE